jgi:poly(3-hydroxybutyrate) depolymerase
VLFGGEATPLFRREAFMKRLACVFVLNLCFVSPVFAASLPSFGIDIYQTSVSGVSSGGAMAVQMHVAHSSIMRGVGVIAGVAYGCVDPRLPLAAPPGLDSRVARSLGCMDGGGSFGGAAGADFSKQRTNDAATVPNHQAIDDLKYLKPQKVWLFSGYNDGTVRRGAMDAVAKYYENYVNVGNVFYQTENHAPHALVTADYGITCLDFHSPYVNDCNYDAAGFLLKHIYGSLNPPNNNKLSGSFKSFNQEDFVDGGIPALVGLADKGYAYVPKACKTETCRVHVVFHGCEQYQRKVHTAVYKHAGYNKWADTNKLIVLYPQTEADLLNPKGCWDWAGFYNALPNADFAQKTGHQIAAIRAMLDHLAKMPRIVSSDTFGQPQNIQVSDTTSTSLALTWQPNSAATGFNIRRSSSSNGTYTIINSGLVTGASFADQNLSPNTTYYYKISAVDGSNVESAQTGPVSGTTASVPPGCEPYYSDNLTHFTNHRAERDGVINAKAKGSGDKLGLLSATVSTHLIKVGPGYYRLLYCP